MYCVKENIECNIFTLKFLYYSIAHYSVHPKIKNMYWLNIATLSQNECIIIWTSRIIESSYALYNITMMPCKNFWVHIGKCRQLQKHMDIFPQTIYWLSSLHIGMTYMHIYYFVDVSLIYWLCITHVYPRNENLAYLMGCWSISTTLTFQHTYWIPTQ